jgi:flavin reductase (DIM6/NTAB) family NADH-FMN oxidoreductase RutF
MEPTSPDTSSGLAEPGSAGAPDPARASGPAGSGPAASGPAASGAGHAAVAGSAPVDGVPVDDRSFRAAFGRFATGVAVMTTHADAQPHGMTANAVTSVSLDPPLVLVCVERGTVLARKVAASGVFALTFLAEDQAAVSTRFADPSRPAGAAQFAGIATAAAPSGSLVLSEGVAWVDCRVTATHDGGDHLIVVGEVTALDPGATDGLPLLYHRGGYGRFAPGADA